ncbi:MAG: exodeoxyribonuclease VII large subunit [Bacteroidales bacterium]|nr:exodeoxyribonuclease VII large subunit [Bacteroidales bacterium]
MEALRLSELTLLIKETINISFAEFYTVIAEVNQLNVNNYSGHAYLQLVEKKENSDSVISNIRAIIWANKFKMLQAYFRTITGAEITEDIKILAKVEVSYHEVYGMSLIIHDIDPTYTLGDIEKRRQEIIDQLTDDGVINMNKNIEFPLVPQRIAVISSATAAGLSDFLDHLTNNEQGYNVSFKLFEATMQGEKTEKSIIKALDDIFNNVNNFDLVVIIRGGGSKLDLSAFDSYNIAVNIAQFPLPVITGIGHHRDSSIADIVAYKSLKTPTAVADFIIQKIDNFYNYLSEKYDYLTKIIQEKISTEEFYLEKAQSKLKIAISDYIFQNQITITNLSNNLKYSSLKFIENKIQFLNQKKHEIKLLSKNSISQNINKLQKQEMYFNNQMKIALNNAENKLKIIDAKLQTIDPQNILNIGFSITYKNGKAIKNTENLIKGDKIYTKLKSGNINSTVE